MSAIPVLGSSLIKDRGAAPSGVAQEGARKYFETKAYNESLLANDQALTGDQRKARAAEANLRAVAPRYQGTGLAQMFGAQGTQAAKTRLGQ